MVKFVSDKINTTATIQAYLGQTFKDYSTYLDRAPVFVKYYSKNSLESTNEKTLQAVNNIAGRDSPVVFNSIENIPLYTISQLDFNTSNDGFGNEADASGDAIIIPSTIVPNIDDFFVVQYEKTKYTYRLSDVNINKLKGNTYYRINFYLSDKTELQLDSQVFQEKAVTPDITDNKKFIIVDKSESLFLEKLLSIKEKIQDDYTRIFYSKLFDDLCLKWEDAVCSDREVKLFIKKHNLLKKLRPMRNEIHLSNNLLYDEDIDNFESRLSLFNMIEGKIAVDDFKCVGIHLTESKKRSWEVFFHHPVRVYTADYPSKLKSFYLKEIFEGLYNFLVFEDDEEVSNWYENLLSYTEEEALGSPSKTEIRERETQIFKSRKIKPVYKLIKLMSQNFEGTTAEIETVLESLEPVKPSLDDYYLTPIVLFILDKLYTSKY